MHTKGSSSTFQSLTGSLESYTVWCKSPSAFTNPDSAAGVNIRITGDVRDTSQKAFEILIQSISLRALPVILKEPEVVEDLSTSGASALSGEGFVWSFSTERKDQFILKGDPVGLLVTELHNIVLPNGVTVVTSGVDQNIEFKQEKLC